MSDELQAAESTLIPPIGTVSPTERMLRVNWVSQLERSPSGSPLLWPEFVARQGPSVRIIDVREPDELVGPLGHIAGADWVPRERVMSLLERLDHDEKIVLVSRAGERSGPLALALEQAGMRFVASMIGGMVSWKYLGFATTRDPAILGRRDQLRADPLPKKGEKPLSLSAVEAHIGDPQSVRWMKLAALLLHGRQSCVDGRDETGVIGTPGGDAGEMLLALGALERVTGTKLIPLQVRALLERRLSTFGRFYLHSDVHSANELIGALRRDRRLDSAIATTHDTLGWRKFFAAPPVHVREAVLEHALVPEHIGCGHLRLMMKAPDVYGVRRELVIDLLRAFFRALWARSAETEFVPLPGGHDEGAVVNVRVEEPLYSFTHVPLVSPSCGGTQMFVNHPQVSEYQRAQLVGFLRQQEDVIAISAAEAEALQTEMRSAAAAQMGATLGKLAAGLPIYEIAFGRDGNFHVAPVGTVGG